MIDIKQIADWICTDCGDFRIKDWFIFTYGKCGFCIDEIKKYSEEFNGN